MANIESKNNIGTESAIWIVTGGSKMENIELKKEVIVKKQHKIMGLKNKLEELGYKIEFYEYRRREGGEVVYDRLYLGLYPRHASGIISIDNYAIELLRTSGYKPDSVLFTEPTKEPYMIFYKKVGKKKKGDQK